jgi:acyl dehydratase
MASTSIAYQPRGKYFEQFAVGDVFVTPRRTVTQADIVNFAGVSGDFNAPHVDHEFCRVQPYGEPIARAPLVFAISTGLLCQLGINEQTLVAMLGVDNWRIHAPVKQGDTLHVTAEVKDARPTSKGDRGIVTFGRAIVNQHGTAVQTMTVQCMYLCSPAAPG